MVRTVTHKAVLARVRWSPCQKRGWRRAYRSAANSHTATAAAWRRSGRGSHRAARPAFAPGQQRSRSDSAPRRVGLVQRHCDVAALVPTRAAGIADQLDLVAVERDEAGRRLVDGLLELAALHRCQLEDVGLGLLDGDLRLQLLERLAHLLQ